MAVNDHTRHVLYFRSGNRCAFPKCNRELVEEKTESDRHSIVGIICHIKGQKPGSARYDPDVSEEERDSVENLVVFCPTHHKIVDDQANEYTVKKLQDIKRRHKEWVRKQLSREIPEVTFAELDIITKYLVATCPSDTSISIIPPRDKIRKNELSPTVENLVRMGLARTKLVREFIRRNPDQEFGERLKVGFVEKYNELAKKGIQGNILFDSLLEFASNRSSNFREQAAGLAILSYYFEACDVFET